MGFFVVFEGLDGSGSSTQAQLLERYFKMKQRAVMSTKEPTNNLIGGLIRGQLTHEWKSSMECLQLLFAADRAHHLEKEIIPALRRNFVVISDRYKLSSIAYGSLEADIEWLREINKQFREPDLTILLKVSPDTCVKRMDKRHIIELFEKRDKLTKVWEVYKTFASDNVVIIDGERPIDDVFAEVIENVNEKLKGKEVATFL